MRSNKYNIDKFALQWLVDRYNVGTPWANIRTNLRKRMIKGQWPSGAIKAGLAFAKRRHEANINQYNKIMGGFI